ncbi:sodium pump decarboxylase, gamma subunit [Treponema lecithinolyticum ATCC 700332]|uniref:Sodium pump decarboxylase, gamma subunit n=2 Tax=Treponema lecithinolyticum TaxID=53418 RepID=A0ABN0P0X3_TRELE|nr:sodium pump decarboxylase, gamma subunit [Treponema lecithinolyticum ATCC 700332]
MYLYFLNKIYISATIGGKRFRMFFIRFYNGGCMTITEMLGQSLILTLLGMGVVFSFLIIMVVVITVASKIIKALKLDRDDASAAAPASAAGGTQTAVVAAIAAAVREKQNN